MKSLMISSLMSASYMDAAPALAAFPGAEVSEAVLFIPETRLQSLRIDCEDGSLGECA